MRQEHVPTGTELWSFQEMRWLPGAGKHGEMGVSLKHGILLWAHVQVHVQWQKIAVQICAIIFFPAASGGCALCLHSTVTENVSSLIFAYIS